MNKLTIIGNLTRSPELRTTQTGIPVCTFTVAVNQRQKEGQEKKTDFFKVTAWRGLGETCGKYLQKGHKVMISGPVGIKEWTGRDGEKKSQMAITAEDMEMLTSKNEASTDIMTAQQKREADQKEAQYQQQEREAIQKEPPAYVNVDDDDLPF